MLSLEYPWLLLILPLPFILRKMLSSIDSTSKAALLTPMYNNWRTIDSGTKSTSVNLKLLLLASISWFCLVIAATNPLWLDEPITQTREARDLLLAVDISGSMDTRGMIVNNTKYPRISATKSVLSAFISRRKNDQLGLILFGHQAFLQTPLTFDHKTIQQMLDESVIGLAGAQRTAVGDAIGLAVKRLKNRPTENKVLILLTDGANNTGVDPIKYSELAALEKIRIYTVGVGAESIVTDGFFGKRIINPSQDLDEKTLKKIAAITGGKYFRARDPNELNKIYHLLDELEPNEVESDVIRPQKTLFYWPLFVSVFLFMLLLLLQSTDKKMPNSLSNGERL